jgi:acyl carrier protein
LILGPVRVVDIQHRWLALASDLCESGRNKQGGGRPEGRSGHPERGRPVQREVTLVRPGALRAKKLVVAEALSMTVRDRVFSAFKESFDLEDDANTSKLVYQDFPAWTSVGHMILIAALESEFDTMLETDDILEMSNFEKTVSIMSKYANDA